MTMHSKAKMWSLLGTTPVLYYVDQADAYGVAWNGIFMGHKQAIQLAAFQAFKIAPSPRARHFSLVEFNKLYMCGGFGEQTWKTKSSKLDNWHYLCSMVAKNHVGKTLNNISPQTLFDWFSTKNALKPGIEHENLDYI